MESRKLKDLRAAVKHCKAIEKLHKKYPETVPLVLTDMSMIELYEAVKDERSLSSRKG